MAADTIRLTNYMSGFQPENLPWKDKMTVFDIAKEKGLALDPNTISITINGAPANGNDEVKKGDLISFQKSTHKSG